MASSKEYLDFVLDQLSDLRGVTHRAMMGEYIIYYNGKIIGGIYDDRFLVKVTPASKKLMLDAQYEIPYDGGSKMLLVDDIDDREFLKELFNSMYNDLPEPKEKKSKVKQITKEKFFVYRREAKKGEADYSPLPHDAPHKEGGKEFDGMRERATRYCFNKIGKEYEAELDEAWYAGSRNGGGTMTEKIPKAWFELPYDGFLSNVLTLVGAAHYGFSVEQLNEKKGLKEFFNYDKGENK